ncbi:MAG: hypothetical protein BJ554DRAFT_4444, partial [Olpidium bornovanus]
REVLETTVARGVCCLVPLRLPAGEVPFFNVGKRESPRNGKIPVYEKKTLTGATAKATA